MTKKNIGRIAKEARKGGTSKSRTVKSKTTRKKTKSNPKRGKRMGKSTSRSLFKLARTVSLFTGVADAIAHGGSINSKVDRAISNYGAYSFMDKKFHWDRLLIGYGPFAVTSIVPPLLSKVVGIVRRL